MMEIIYTGLQQKTLNAINNSAESNGGFIEFSESDFQKFLIDKKHLKSALLLGEEVKNPIKIVQEAYALDPNISILVIAEPQNFNKIKNALLLSPFIGPTVKCVLNNDIGELTSIIKKISSMTDQRRSFEKLKSVEIFLEPKPNLETLKKEYVAKFFEQAPVGAILLNNEGIIMAINKHASMIFCNSEKELLGSYLDKLFQDTVRKEVIGYINETFKSLPKKIFERYQNDNIQYLEIQIVDIPSSHQYKIGIVRDITDKIISEKTINRQVDDLELANKNLKTVNADLDNFVYTASHDLKAPILNIEGLLDHLFDLLRNETVDHTEIEVLKELIFKSVNRFKETLQDLSDITKVQRTTQDDIEEVNIKNIFNEVIETIFDAIVESNAEIHYDLDDDYSINFSKVNLKSIIYNLLINAIKYKALDRNPLITVKSYTSENYDLLEIADNGMGIQSQHKEKIFNMFKRFHDHVEGTGLGLYIVKRIIDNAGGKIEVESQVGEGSVFKIYFFKKN